MPRGRSPVGMVRVTSSVSASITEIVSSFSLVTQISSAAAGAAARSAASAARIIPCLP